MVVVVCVSGSDGGGRCGGDCQGGFDRTRRGGHGVWS